MKIQLNVGKRILKTALAVFISIFIYILLLFVDKMVGIDSSEWEAPSNMYTPFFAAIAAVYALHKDRKSSFAQAKIRSMGSIIGGYFGMLVILISEYFLIDVLKMNETNFILFKFITFVWISLGIIPLIVITVNLKQKTAVFITCLTYLSVTISIRNGGMPIVQFATNRVLSTLVGVGVSLVINNIASLQFKRRDVMYCASLNNSFIKEDKMDDFIKYKIASQYYKDMPMSFVTTRALLPQNTLFKDIDVNFPMVLMNGSVIYDFKHRRYENIICIDDENRFKIESLLKRAGLNSFTYYVDKHFTHCYYTKLENEGERHYFEVREKTKDYIFVRAPFPEELSTPLFVCIDRKNKIDEFINYLKDEGIDTLLDVVVYPYRLEGYYYMKINSKDATKEGAIKKIFEEKNFSKLVVCGSGRTDIPLIKMADFSVALKTAPQYVKDEVDVVLNSDCPATVLKVFDKIYHSRNFDSAVKKISKKYQ